MTTDRPCGTTLSPEILEQQLKQLEQKIIGGKADCDAFEDFIAYQLEQAGELTTNFVQSYTQRDPQTSS